MWVTAPPMIDPMMPSTIVQKMAIIDDRTVNNGNA